MVGFCFRFCQRGKKHPGQDCDDGNHHQQLDQSERAAAGCRRAWPNLM
jgi:hypothetical protein